MCSDTSNIQFSAMLSTPLSSRSLTAMIYTLMHFFCCHMIATWTVCISARAVLHACVSATSLLVISSLDRMGSSGALWNFGKGHPITTLPWKLMHIRASTTTFVTFPLRSPHGTSSIITRSSIAWYGLRILLHCFVSQCRQHYCISLPEFRNDDRVIKKKSMIEPRRGLSHIYKTLNAVHDYRFERQSRNEF